MHIAPETAAAPAPLAGGAAARVAVAGATGYAGQELLRLLARHPAVTVAAAMSSASAGGSRRLPALSRVWTGEIRPLDVEALAGVVANPGCYPTASLLALAPLVAADLLLPGSDIVIDAKSGVSGAGKTPSERTHFSECHGSVAAYGVFDHRHGAEIEQGIGGPLTFVPHLVPLDRGILATTYVRLKADVAPGDVAAAYERAYAGAAFVRLTGASLPEIKHVAHTNFCDVGWRVDASGRAVIVSVIDNLVKGAAGQAVQNMNVMLGLEETAGLL